MHVFENHQNPLSLHTPVHLCLSVCTCYRTFPPCVSHFRRSFLSLSFRRKNFLRAIRVDIVSDAMMEVRMLGWRSKQDACNNNHVLPYQPYNVILWGDACILFLLLHNTMASISSFDLAGEKMETLCSLV